MRIVIDARWIFPRISGIGAYTRELVAALARHGSEHTFILLFDRADLRDRTLAETGLAGAPNVESVLVDYGVFAPASQLRLPGRLRALEADLYHAPNYLIPLPAFPRNRRGRIGCVVTVHDMIPLKFPEFAPRSRKNRVLWLFRLLMREIGRRADAIVADSESSRRDAIAHMAIPPHRAAAVHTVHCGVSERYLAAGDARPAQRPAGPLRILYVGRADPYKNLCGLLRAFHRARQDGLPSAELRIAGPPDPRYPEPQQLAAELGLGEAVRWLGYLDEDALLEAYVTADVLALPSRYEGFGLPVVEAMAAGTPVVCSDCGSLPEVAGDAAWIVPPDDIPGLATALTRLLTDPSVAAEHRRRGRQRARMFTWSRAAAAMLDIYTRSP